LRFAYQALFLREKLGLVLWPDILLFGLQFIEPGAHIMLFLGLEVELAPI
jgi:hypothetical protein